ncbi:hypothetical protein GOP47_0019720 [Adiantum capillus-veneris]|uniref:Uncharacterized protein n=1 Tax=Adiantum capillus-veneris TaxID=13818 RepID=A0A9D4UC27_ADICA|nr:hypothetical protein GOP47_0019720 [Adiantum capillus-veneris]
MISPYLTSENHSNANEHNMYVGEDKQVFLHLNERPLSHIDKPLLPPYDGQARVSTIGRCKTYPNAIVPDNVDAPLTSDREARQMSTTSCDSQHPPQELIVDKGMLVIESPGLEPLYKQRDGSFDSEHPPQELILDKGVLVNESPSLEPLHRQRDGSSCADVFAMIDIGKLIAESQHSSSAAPEFVRTSEPSYIPGSPPLHPRFLTVGSGFEGQLVKKLSIRKKNEPPSMDHTLQSQPLKRQYSLSVTSHDDDPNGFRNMPKEENYEFFRTRSGISEGRMSRVHSRQEQEQQKQEIGNTLGKRNKSADKGSVSAGRYFDALRGPELEILKDSEELLLPLEQRWPFLLRFPVVSFGISLGLATQANLWKIVAMSPSMTFLHVPLGVNFALWCLALFVLVATLIIYALKCLLYFEAVRREFHHPVRVNFFFAPWIGCMLIGIGIPPSIATRIHPSFWCVFITPLLILELKIYGQWLSGGKRRLSKVANASTHVSLVANFVSAILGAQVGWIEPALFFWAVGCAHYLVLFVTLYQRLPSAEALSKELHPVFFLFIAAPSTASVAWRYIVGEFDQISKVVYYVALFLFVSLVVRVKFFCGFRFSIAWWAYTFPMTALANATVQYSIQVRHSLTQVLAVTFSAFATLTVLIVFLWTILHIMWGSLFPNDIAIAITNQRHREKHKSHHQASTNPQRPISSYKDSKGVDWHLPQHFFFQSESFIRSTRYVIKLLHDCNRTANGAKAGFMSFGHGKQGINSSNTTPSSSLRNAGQ